jgi:hypothetical protein
LFKLYLGNLVDNLKPKLPVDYKKAITDYLREIGRSIEEEVTSTWHGIVFLEKVLVVITVPAEYSEKDKEVMRECAYKAGLIIEKESKNLQFTTERKNEKKSDLLVKKFDLLLKLFFSTYSRSCCNLLYGK